MPKVLKSSQRRRKLIVQAKMENATTLLEALAELMPEATRTTRKQYLRDRCVLLQGKPTTQHDAPVCKGARIEIYTTGFPEPFSCPSAHVVWQDDYFILLEKKPGLATVSNHPGLKTTLFRLLANYLKADDASEKIFLLNRLDRETYGFILFARSREVQQQVLAEWGRFIVAQRFTAVVEGLFEIPEGDVKGKLRQKSLHGKASKPTTRRSETTYKVLGEGEWSSLVELTLHGRFNGIRTLLQEAGFPIVGENTPLAILQNSKGLLLRQTQMAFRHPITAKLLSFDLPIPPSFRALLTKPLTRGEKRRIMEQQGAAEQSFNQGSKVKKTI